MQAEQALYELRVVGTKRSEKVVCCTEVVLNLVFHAALKEPLVDFTHAHGQDFLVLVLQL